MNLESMPISDRLMQAATWEQGLIDWPSGQEKAVTCCRVVLETSDVKSFYFRTGDGVPFRFEPGQYVTITAEIEGKLVSRCYTISSPPTRPYTFSITVKRVPGGPVSNWLHDNLSPGHMLRAFGPAGDFTPTSNPANKLLFLSAGSGITPLMSMTRAGIDLGQDLDVVFLHSARTPGDIVFRKELSEFARLAQNMRVLHVCESFGDERDWSGPVGRLSLELLQQFVPDFKEREAFACGPDGYMKAARELLERGGHDPSHYHQESFNLGAPSVEPIPTEVVETPSATPASSRAFSVRLAKSNRTFEIDPSQTVLSAVKKSGGAIASSCQQGICGSCKTLVLEGSVEMKHQGGIRQREVDKGFRLLCCSYPTSDLVLDL